MISVIIYNENKENAIIFSHGNATDNFNMKSYYKKLSEKFNLTIIGYDYLGYGLSDNTEINEESCYRSHEAVINYYKNKYTEIYLIGQSLGTGIVVDYVSKNPQWNTLIILISPYKSILSVIGLDTLCFDMFKSIDKINKCKCPIKFYHGKNDTIIHFSHSIELYEKITNNKKIKPIILPNVSHNDILYHIF